MKTQYYLTKKKIKVTDDFTIEKHKEIIGYRHLNGKTVTIFTRYWFEVPREILIFLEKFT